MCEVWVAIAPQNRDKPGSVRSPIAAHASAEAIGVDVDGDVDVDVDDVNGNYCH